MVNDNDWTLSHPALVPTSSDGFLLDLGQQPRSRVRGLKRGMGDLVGEIRAAVERWRDEFEIQSDTEIVPVVLLYRQDEPDYVVLFRSFTQGTEDIRS
jgi:hypothetical protein